MKIRLSNTDVSGFLREFESLTTENPLNPRERYIDGAAMQVAPFNGSIYIASVRAFEFRRGYGTKAMKLITDLADKHKVRLTLEASDYAGVGMSEQQLIKWYKKQGFTLDSKHDNLMTRKPNS